MSSIRSPSLNCVVSGVCSVIRFPLCSSVCLCGGTFVSVSSVFGVRSVSGTACRVEPCLIVTIHDMFSV